MSVTATLDAAVNAAIANVDQFQEVTFGMTLQKAASSVQYDPVTGTSNNTNPATGANIILPEASLSEIDGESLKTVTLQGIVLRSWLPGVSIEIDDIITVLTGVFQGKYIVFSEPVQTVVHFELNLKRP